MSGGKRASLPGLHPLAAETRSIKSGGVFGAVLKGFTMPTPLLGGKAEAGHADRDFMAAEKIFLSSSSLVEAMNSFGKRHALTQSTLVHAAWALLLSRYSGEQDIVFGSTGSGRSADLEGIESMVGLFVNTLPVRARFSPQDSVLPWLKDFQNDLVELRQYEHGPLVDVQGWSEVGREHPLFESILAFENYPVDASVWGQDGTLRLSDMRVRGPTNYPLTVIFVPGKELRVRVTYDSRRFEEAAISRMMGMFYFVGCDYFQPGPARVGVAHAHRSRAGSVVGRVEQYADRFSHGAACPRTVRRRKSSGRRTPWHWAWATSG